MRSEKDGIGLLAKLELMILLIHGINNILEGFKFDN